MTSDLIWTRSDELPTETGQKQEQAGKRREKHPRRPETKHWPGILGNNPLCARAISRYYIILIEFSCSHASTLPNSAIDFQWQFPCTPCTPAPSVSWSDQTSGVNDSSWFSCDYAGKQSWEFFCQCNASDWRLLYPSNFIPAGLKIATFRYSFGNINYGSIFC